MYKILVLILCLTYHFWIFGTDDDTLIQDTLTAYFHDIPKEAISIEPIAGGFETAIYAINTPTTRYALRIFPAIQSSIQTQHEIYAMKSGAACGVSPAVYYVSPSHQVVLLEFIKGRTATIDEVRSPQNCIKVVQMLRSIHSFEKNPYPSLTILGWGEQYYERIVALEQDNPETKIAIQFLREKEPILEMMTTRKVNIHGDLNCRNIFIGENDIQLIDWAHSGWEDPFYDLSYLVLLNALNAEEEQFLLESYLERAPTHEEVVRYELIKKMNCASLYLNLHLYALEQLKAHLSSELDYTISTKHWEHYIQVFYNDSEDLPLQFYSEWARSYLRELGECS